MYYVLNLASYYLYSGDLDFVRSQYAIVQRQMAYNRALVDPTTGLLISNSSERDWDFYDGGKPGAVTAYNAIYYKALTDAAYHGERARQHGRCRDVLGAGGRPQAAHQRDAVRRRPRRLQAGRPRQRQPRRQLGAAGRQLGGDLVRHRARERARRHPELAAHQPVGAVRPAAVLERRELLDGDQPVRDRARSSTRASTPATRRARWISPTSCGIR